MNIPLIVCNIILITSSTSCMHQQNKGSHETHTTATAQQQKIEKIELTERTRGFSKSIVITPVSKTATTNDAVAQTKISSSEWNTFSKLAETIDLSKISDLQSPTTGRESDRALISSIVITSNGKDYTSASFDSGNPPKELEALYHAINSSGKAKTP